MDEILCELYADTRSDVSDNSDNKIMESDSDVPTTSSHKQLRPSAVIFTGDSETSTEEEESSELESYDNKTSDVWCKTDKKNPSNKPFLGITGLSIVIDNSESVVEVVSSIIGDDCIQLFTEQSNPYRSQNAEKWRILPKTQKCSNITPEEMRKFLGNNNFDGTSQKGKYKRLLIH